MTTIGRTIGDIISTTSIKSFLAPGKKRDNANGRFQLTACLFDEAWYVSQNGDVASAGIDPLEHYCLHGWREGRRPNPIFDPTWYRRQNPDVGRLNKDPLAHFVEYGRFEGRHPSREFDPAEYLRQNPEVAAQGLEPCEHYIRHGRTAGESEKREPATAALDAAVAAASDIETVSWHVDPDQVVAEATAKLVGLDQKGANWRDRLLVKRIHSVGEARCPVPDGLSLAYIELADELNDLASDYEAHIAAAPHDLIGALEALIQREISESMKLEYQLLARSVAR